MENSPTKSGVSYGDEMRSVVSLDDISDTFDDKKLNCSVLSTGVFDEESAPLLVKNIRRYSRTKKL